MPVQIVRNSYTTTKSNNFDISTKSQQRNFKNKNISFGKKEKYTYKKSHFFTMAGVVTGTMVGLLPSLGVLAIPTPKKLKVFKKLGAVGLTAFSAFAGGIIGCIQDFTVNKAVKNSLESMKMNFDLKQKK